MQLAWIDHDLHRLIDQKIALERRIKNLQKLRDYTVRRMREETSDPHEAA